MGKKRRIILTLRVDLLIAVYFRRGLTCTLWLANDFIDGGQKWVKKLCMKRELVSLYVDGALALGWPHSTKSLVNALDLV